ncbi:hypothetical protein MRB53_002633 [Persea americana]|uniref:Uncharacterized protein n=1 Tax=Persea americana TaxID=3435 RepID=A0ACC2MW05_PERAE|nr:hypothetical protein MRB53_002633 [Persea americana]
MANEYAAAAASYEGGAGGKIRRRLPRRTTPYDRPPTALRNPSTDGRSSWLSKLVDPASRIISGSAARLFSSVFRKRLTGPHSASEMNSEPGHELPKDTCITPSTEQGQGSIKGDDPSKIFDDHGINELGQLLKQKTFTRVEFDHLSELLRSRTVDLFAGNQNIITEPSTSRVATTCVSQENTTISPEDVEEEAGSPAELAKAYMGTGLSKVSPPLCLQSGNIIGPSSLKSPNLPFATISSSRLSGLSENGHMTQTLRSRSALYKMSRSPYSRGVEPADNGYAGPSTPSHWPRTNEMLSTGKQDVEEEAGSPVELAKAYMGKRSSKVSPPLRLRSQTSREDATLLNSVPSLLKSSNMPFATRSSGLSENGHLIQTPRGRSALYKMARSPYFRGVEPTDNGYAVPSTPSQWPRTNEMLSTGKQLLKRRSSVLDDDFGSVGPIRRIRQKSSMMSPSKDRNVNSVPLLPLLSDSTCVSKSSIQKLHPLVEPKHYDLNPQAAENGNVKISNASFPAVPPQSSEMARNILEQLDKLVPSPKEKSSELKLVMARENPPLKLTLENLNGRALMSMKAIESPKLQNGQDSGSLNGLSSTHSLKSGNLVAEKKDKVGDNGSMKKPDLRVMSSSEAGGVDNAIVSLEHISSVMKPVDSLVSGPTVALPQNKQAFKMSAPEDSLEMDDEDDVYISKNTVNPCSAEKEKPNPSFSECKTVASETVIIEKPTASPESKPATATNFTLNKRADLTARVSDGPNLVGKAVGFTFPTAVPSTPNPPQPSSTSQLTSFLNPPVLAEEKTGFPLFSFDSKSSDKGHTNFTFSSTVSKVSDAFGQNSGAGSDSKLDLLNSNVGTSMTSPVTPPEAKASNKDSKTLEVGNLYRSNDNAVSAGVSTSAIPNIFSLGASTNSSQSNGLLMSSAISVSSTSTNVASGSSTGPIFSSSPAATIGSNIPSISATFATSAPSIFKFGSGSSTDVASSNSVAAPPVTSGLQLTGSEPKSMPSFLFNTTGSSLSTAASTSFTSTTSTVFGLNSSASASTLNSSSAANHSHNSTPFVATSGSLFSTQVAPAVSSFPAFTQTMPSQFGSSASASLFGSGSSFGSSGSSSFVSTSSFGSTTDGAKLFGSGTVFGLSSSSSFSTGSSSFSSSSSSLAPSGTTSLFGSSSQPAASSIFGSGFSSSSPSTTFSFGASTTAGSTPPAFGSSLGASSGSSMFSFTSAAAASSSSTLSSVQPVFGMSNPVDFGSASPGNDQMNVEDSMAEDTVQASTPTAAPAFGQLANTSSSSNFGFGSTPVPAGGSSVFQFGSHQNTSTPQSPSPFTAPGNLEFPSGGSFSLGTGGVDKSNRKFVRARRDKHRKK